MWRKNELVLNFPEAKDFKDETNLWERFNKKETKIFWLGADTHSPPCRKKPFF